MLQAEKPDDYVIATGESYTVRDFLTRATAKLGLNPDEVVGFDDRYLRPTEVDALVGDASKVREVLGWKATTSFNDLVGIMVDHDLELASRERTLLNAGHNNLF